MARFSTLPQDLDERVLRLRLGISLIDGFTGKPRLVGKTSVRLAGLPLTPFAKTPDATFVFFEAPAGNHTVEVRSDEDTPYYLDADINVVLPAAPDWLHAEATLWPSIAYPFPEGATLIRGTVTASGAALPGATVFRVVAPDLDYVSGPAGEFVLFVPRVLGMGELISVQADHALHPPQVKLVAVRRGLTTLQDFVMAP